MKKLWPLIVVIFAFGITWLMWPNWITDPGHVLMDLGGDGVKNYFTFLFHSVYGKGIHFEGMNYPYGEHVVFTDAQPLLSVTLGYFRNYTQITMADATAALFVALAVSFLLAIIFNYAILREFNVNKILALIFAVLISVCTPQVYRAFGHFGLSYFCIIPMVFFLTIRYHKTSRVFYPVLLLLTSLVVSFLHPYFGAVVLIWSGIYSAGYFLFIKEKASGRFRHIIPLLSAVLIAFISVQGIMSITDNTSDRPLAPSGILSYGTTGSDIFMSPISPIWKTVAGLFPGFEIPDLSEGYAYTGLVTIFVVIIGLIVAIRNRKRDLKPAEKLVSEENYSSVWLFISAVTLLLGMGVPFVWNMSWLLEIVPAFKQFRSMGRFSWMFYYSVTVFAAVAINHWYYRTKEKRKTLAVIGLAASIFVWTIDASGYIKYARERAAPAFYNYETFFTQYRWDAFLNEHNFKPNDFQAILMLPYFHVGTEKFAFGVNDVDWQFTLSMRMAIQLRLPLVDVMMSRSSWSQATAQTRLLGGPLTDKPILNAGTKPFLTLVCTDTNTKIDKGTEYILRAADYIDSFSLFKVYALYPGRLKELDKHITDSIATPYLNVVQRDTCIGCEQQYFINHFDDGSAEGKFLGSDAADVIKGKTDYVAQFSFDSSLGNVTEYEFSAWILVRREDHKLPYFILDVFDDKGDTLVRHEVLLRPTDNHGLWYRIDKYLNLPIGTKEVKCMVVNFNGPTYAAMDELVLKPSKAVLISRLESDSIMINNHLYKRK